MTPTNGATYKELTVETIREAMKALAITRSEESKLVVFTGQEGYDEISRHMEISNAKEQVIFLKEKKAINDEEVSTLNDMLNSSDRENVFIALNIIAVKSKPFLDIHIIKTSEEWQLNLNQPITVTKAPTL